MRRTAVGVTGRQQLHSSSGCVGLSKHVLLHVMCGEQVCQVGIISTHTRELRLMAHVKRPERSVTLLFDSGLVHTKQHETETAFFFQELLRMDLFVS